MAKKSKGPTGLYKQIVKNYCLTCGAEAEIIKVVRTKWTKSQNLGSGMMWRCKQDESHVHRTRRYVVEDVRIR